MIMEDGIMKKIKILIILNNEGINNNNYIENNQIQDEQINQNIIKEDKEPVNS